VPVERLFRESNWDGGLARARGSRALHRPEPPNNLRPPHPPSKQPQGVSARSRDCYAQRRPILGLTRSTSTGARAISPSRSAHVVSSCVQDHMIPRTRHLSGTFHLSNQSLGGCGRVSRTSPEALPPLTHSRGLQSKQSSIINVISLMGLSSTLYYLCPSIKLLIKQYTVTSELPGERENIRVNRFI
jgi:hypothetical protein